MPVDTPPTYDIPTISSHLPCIPANPIISTPTENHVYYNQCRTTADLQGAVHSNSKTKTTPSRGAIRTKRRFFCTWPPPPTSFFRGVAACSSCMCLPRPLSGGRRKNNDKSPLFTPGSSRVFSTVWPAPLLLAR